MTKIKKGSYKSKLNVSFNIVSGVRPLRRRRRAYAPTSNTASHDIHEKINSWVSFSFPYENGEPLVGRDSATTYFL